MFSPSTSVSMIWEDCEKCLAGAEAQLVVNLDAVQKHGVYTQLVLRNNVLIQMFCMGSADFVRV